VAFGIIAGGTTLEAIVIYRDPGTGEANTTLIAYIDSAVNLPVTTNGGNVSIIWDGGTNNIFRL
jgi:hypothetical protein